MAELIGIRVLIKRVPTQHGLQNLYPNFNRLPAATRRSMDWSAYIDLFGSGWHYDQVAPFGEIDPESPNVDEMFGIIAVPEAFAAAAVAMFPAEVSTLTAAEFTTLFDTRTKVLAPDTVINTERLEQLRAKYGIVGPIDDPAAIARMTPEDRKAVDPNDPAPGITNNPIKTLSRYLTKTGHTIRNAPGFVALGGPNPQGPRRS